VKAINYLHPALDVIYSTKKGRGVYARSVIPSHTVIEISPVIVMPAADRVNLDKTLLHDYIFEWGEDEKQCCMALGYIPLYNHSFTPNCEYIMNFRKQLITVKTIRAVKKGEELVFNYNGDKEKEMPLWFEVK
jgi:SET domain-containing protein